MSGVRVGISAAVGSEHLYRHLRGDWSLYNALGIYLLVDHYRVAFAIFHRVSGVVFLWYLNGLDLQHLRRIVRLKVLWNTLSDQKNRINDADRKKQIIVNSHQVHPEIADRLGRVPGDPPEHWSGNRNSDRCGGKVLPRQCQHLRQITHRRFATVALPVRVGSETPSRVKSEVVRYRSLTLWIQRQEVLEAKN